MKKSFVTVVCVLGAVGFYWFAQAGSLDPPDPPAPTMKSLDVIPPAWSQRLDSTNGSTTPFFEGCDSSRFKCVMREGSPLSTPRAVLDLETGLVWERAPESGLQSWTIAVQSCIHREAGGRRGWRLPAISELASLFDPGETDPALPPGHPFLNVTEPAYWSSTTWPDGPGYAFFVLTSDGIPREADKLADLGIWCVRGGAPTSFTSSSSP